ncbi:four helix bundle protein [Saccharicrinis sp. FJH62]|uniref:four helix bundle protein n=1 Tax=Saccharicrinis sp. FJH62 TaxID=3344657 RepID=UPI0035D49592
MAEGFERSSDIEFKRFLFIAKASCGEIRSMIYLAKELGYILEETQLKLLEKSSRLSSSIMNFIKYLEKDIK